MISRTNCLKLLDKHGIRGRVLNHILKVEQIAVFLGEKLKGKGINIDIDLLRVSALLHDIGKDLADHTKMDHVEAGVTILKEEGLSEIAEVIRKHPINAIVEEDKIPMTWEEKLVFYADRRACEDQLVSVDERILDLRRRYPSIDLFIAKAEPKIKQLEKEIFDKIDVDVELNELKKD